MRMAHTLISRSYVIMLSAIHQKMNNAAGMSFTSHRLFSTDLHLYNMLCIFQPAPKQHIPGQMWTQIPVDPGIVTSNLLSGR